jgi:ubiquinol-cytochrome c reductase cytochrome c1 subunit
MRAIAKAVGGAAMSLALLMGGHAAIAAVDVETPESQDWHFEGWNGTVDRASAQRGLQIYLENCAGCHSLNLVAYRNLEALGFSEDEVKAIAADYTVIDGPDDFGDMFERPALPSDKFVPPFENEAIARLSNNGALPPDLSLITKARKDGANYTYALLLGYQDPPEGTEVMLGMSYNPYFPGHQIAMPQLLYDDGTVYADGTPATADQQAWDIVNFLQWAAEPHMEERKQMGVKVIIYLLAFAAIMYAFKRKIWAGLH